MHTKITHANVEDEAAGRAVVRIDFNTVAGERRQIDVPRERAGDVDFVRDQMMMHNAGLPLDREEAAQIIRAALEAPPSGLVVRCANTGWRGDSFVSATGVSNDRDLDGRKLLPPMPVDFARRQSGAARGDLKGWRKVGEICKLSPLIQVLLATAFTPPLLASLGRHSFAVHVAGSGAIGVDYALMAARSVSGGIDRASAPTWRDAGAGRDELRRLHCDLLMPLVADPAIDPGDAYETFRSAVIGVVESRRRPSVDGFGAPSRTIVLSVADHSIDHYAGAAGRERDPIERELCLEIDASEDGRRRSVIIADCEVNRRAFLAELREVCAENHGVAIHHYADHLLGRSGRPARAARHARSFERRLLDDLGLGGDAPAAMGNAALIYAGGCMAIEAGLLPFTKQRLGESIRECFGSSFRTALLEREPS